jgi:hypothetical protein
MMTTVYLNGPGWRLVNHMLDTVHPFVEIIHDGQVVTCPIDYLDEDSFDVKLGEGEYRISITP